MGMPHVPERDCLPSMEEVVIQILESVAIEELAMAHILNAEGERMQAIVAQMNKKSVCYGCISSAFNETKVTINSLIMKEWVMLNKIYATFDIYSKIEGKSNDCTCRGQQKDCSSCKCSDKREESDDDRRDGNCEERGRCDCRRYRECRS